MILFDTAVVDIQSQLQGTNIPMDLGKFIERFAGVGLTIAALCTFAFLLWGGFEWIVSGGDKAKVEAARQHMTNAIVGLLIFASVFAVFSIVQYLLGIDLVK